MPSRVCHSEGHGRRKEPGAAPKDPPGYGEWGRKVGAGTGEALLGPWPAVSRSEPSYNRCSREVAGSREGGGEGRSSEDGSGQHNRAGAKGPCFTNAFEEAAPTIANG